MISIDKRVTTPAEDASTESLWWIHLDTLQEPLTGHGYFLVIMGYDDEAEKDSVPSLQKCAGLVLKHSSDYTYQRIGSFESRPSFDAEPDYDSDMGIPLIHRIIIV